MTTIEQFLQNRLIGFTVSSQVIEDAANSPAEQGLDALFLSDNAYPSPMTDDFMRRRDYAEGTLYYMSIGMFSSSGEKKQIGNRSYTSASISISLDDKSQLLNKANGLRTKWGYNVEETDNTGIMDNSKSWSYE